MLSTLQVSPPLGRGGRWWADPRAAGDGVAYGWRTGDPGSLEESSRTRRGSKPRLGGHAASPEKREAAIQAVQVLRRGRPRLP